MDNLSKVLKRRRLLSPVLATSQFQWRAHVQPVGAVGMRRRLRHYANSLCRRVRPFCISGHLYSWRSQQNARMKETKGAVRPSHSPKQKSSLFCAHKDRFFINFKTRFNCVCAAPEKPSAGGTINLQSAGQTRAFITHSKKRVALKNEKLREADAHTHDSIKTDCPSPAPNNIPRWLC